MNNQTRKITTIGMLCAFAYAAVVLCRIPVVLFLKYEPKDVIIAIGGLIWGPLTAFAVSCIVSFIEMITISESGFLGLVMNILASCCFACTAAVIYKKKRTLWGAVLGLLVGSLLMVGVMILWNYLITPIYMGYPREAVAALLVPAILPFNLLKGGLNTAFTLLLYKPIIMVLRRTHFVAQSATEEASNKYFGLWILAVVIIVTCVMVILSLRGIL